MTNPVGGLTRGQRFALLLVVIGAISTLEAIALWRGIDGAALVPIAASLAAVVGLAFGKKSSDSAG